MRLHALSVTAFGPFAERTDVDFDALSEASVFLLCGDTGAGKSTVLDAVCFALYGDLPSDRARAKQLRSHFAAAGVAPRVVLDTTLAGRRLRFTRSPAWQRAKRRGTGTTTEQAHVLVEELVDDEWLLRTNRLDEAGHLLDAVLGMTKEQFSQVVLLPQGQFDTFLSAASEDRQRVLTQLFRTRRFEDVERWLVEHRTALRRDSERHRDRVTGLLHHLAEAAAADLPDDLTDHLDDDAANHRAAPRPGLSLRGSGPEVDAGSDDGPAAESDAGPAAAWAAGLAHEAEQALTAAREEVDESTRLRGVAERAVEEAAEHLRLRGRHDRARQALFDLAATDGEARADQRRLDDARRAAAVVPLLAPTTRAEDAAATARAAAATALAALSAPIASPADEPSAADLAGRAIAARTRAGRIEALLPRADELADLTRERDSLGGRLEETAGETREVLQALADQPAVLTRAEEQVTALRGAAGAAEELERRIEKVRDRERARQELAAVESRLAAAREQREMLRQRQQDAREGLYAVQERRLRSIAAELAADLAVGDECPVCGSGEHPSPARRAPGDAGADDVRTARHALDGAESDVIAADESVRGIESRVTTLTERVGDTGAEEDAAELHEATVALATARAARAALPDAERDLARATGRHGELRSEQARLAAAASGLTERQLEVAQRADRMAEELRGLLADPGTMLEPEPELELESGGTTPEPGAAGADVPTAEVLRAVARRHEALAHALAGAHEALQHRERTRVAAESASAELCAAATAAGFASVPDARDAALPDDACRRLDEALRTRQAQDSEARATLADPDVQAVVEHPAPDLAALRDALAEASSRASAATTRSARAEERCDALARWRSELGAALAAWAPLRDDLEVARSLAELAEGKGTDNTRQMRLSAYVLAARLGQVVAAANERLSRMSDDRYLLEHVAARAVGDRRGGLSLLVRDQWTDETRDPVTLSGGETFVVSLALALGLADVVAGEAGGARIDTLFVDEGFGSLDPDTLELVMDTLDELREGGRVVGVVSHVPELRTRIGTQLVVRKGRHGSALDLRRGTD